MPNFNYLPHNVSEFPNLENVDTYKYDNSFDYGRFDYDQMSLLVCTVPWDMGEAHIGNRTISGIGNVVYFGNKQARDKWFDDIPDNECYRFTTKFKELHRDGFIDVPIPYDMCAKHNYLVVHYEKFANEDSPVIYEGDDGLRDWFWFIREVEFLAPNTTRLHIMDDAFQTWIYDVNVTGMVLERGHAPMFATRADAFLADPLNENAYLLTEDVNYGEASQVKHIDALALNAGDMYACVATTANPLATWGTKAGDTWHVPARSYNVSDGNPSVFVFAMQAASLNTFLSNVDEQVPQFKQTIQGVFFASSELVTTNGSFTFAGTTCYNLVAGRKTFDFVELEKSLFGYSTQYADIAKLYTSPYAHIEITDENGEVDVIKIEDTTGEIQVSAALSLAYPFINIDTHLLGVGGDADVSVTFRNIDAKTFDVSGQWYDTLRSWNVPTFAVVQESAVNYDYSTHFDRKQRVVDYTTAYDNETATASTVQDNANASASTKQTNENATASTVYDNTVATSTTKRTNANASASTENTNVTASATTKQSNANASATAKKDNANASAGAVYDNDIAVQDGLIANKNDAKAAADDKIDNVTNGGSISQTGGSGGYLSDVYDAQLNKLSDDTDADQVLMVQQTQLTNDAVAASAVVNAGGAIGGGVSSGAMAGASVGGVPGAVVGGAVGGIAQAASVSAGTMITISNNSSMVANNISHSNWKFRNARDNAMALTDAQKTYNAGIKNADNLYLENTVERFSGNPNGINRANATRTKTAATDNATRDYNAETGNATRDYNTETGNATLDYNTEIDNADRDYNTETANATRDFNTETANATRDFNTETANAGRDYTTKTDNATNEYDTETANATREYNTATANATRDYTTETANAGREYNTAVANAGRTQAQAQSAITNDTAQAALGEPLQYGAFANGESSATKPMALFAHIVTQSKSAIASAGDEFLRYGYMLDRQWPFDGNWNVGKYFTYWKLKDFWVRNLNVPDMYMDRLRFFLFGGVTIWRKPEDIGNVTVYENFN